jgi:hypothetical protein
MTASETSDGDDGRVRPFADVLRELDRGTTHDDLSRRFRDLLSAVTTLGKKGSLIFKLEVEPVKGVDGGVKVVDTVVAKIPQPDRRASIFYTDRDGNAVRDDPNQLTFDGPLKAVEPATAAAREAPAPGPIREASQ